MKILWILNVLFFSSHVLAAVLVEDGDRVVNQSYGFGVARGLDLRHSRKMGVGLSAAGALGMAGANLEINFTPELSFLGGFGLGTGYQSYHFQVKKVMGGQSILPYLSAGFARWYSTGTPRTRKSIIPGFFSEKFLSDTEIETGKFGENMVYPSLGLQFVQLDGEWKGFSLYAEILILVDIDDMVSQTTGGLGLLYYF